MKNTSSESELARDPSRRSWSTYCHDYGAGVDRELRFRNFGDIRAVRAYGHDELLAEVTLVEDPKGLLLGWMSNDHDYPVMVQHHRLFNMQFPSGYEAEVERGGGTVVRLSAATAP